MKYLLVLVVVWLGLQWWLHQRRQQALRRNAPPPPRVAQATVPCSHCGVHVPQSDAVLQGGQWYCCPQHAAAARTHASAGGKSDSQP